MNNIDNLKPLQTIIKARRSTRSFSSAKPPLEHVNQILESALYAPYGGATGIPLEEIRKIFVFTIGSKTMETVKEILLSAIQANAKKINMVLRIFPFLKGRMGPFSNRLNEIKKNGIPSLDHASYYVIIAEKKGFPPVQKQSIAHALQNIWLSATNLGMGVQLLTATGILSNNKQLLKILNLPQGKYQLDGCVIGIPNNESEIRKEIKAEKFVTWIS